MGTSLLQGGRPRDLPSGDMKCMMNSLCPRMGILRKQEPQRERERDGGICFIWLWKSHTLVLGSWVLGYHQGICYRGAAKEYWPIEEREEKSPLHPDPLRPCRVGWSFLLWWATAGLRKGLMVEGCTNGPDLVPFPSPLLGHFAVPFAERATGTSCFIVLNNRYWIFTNWRSVTTLCWASLLEPFFQQCLLTLCLCAMFW